ncbi:hypothetical protein K2173_027409 [Erythroxylum novogranatense]|uniref:Uncharacterized protein n=1 Tax=Erythroxylum novogranatense TaxID=1862640 RepID=A0AAV8TZ62_9ROSI|nr:hypothetical protein K2173_027409 [Erythroxylum novogranatense]
MSTRRCDRFGRLFNRVTSSMNHAFFEANSEHESCQKLLQAWDSSFLWMLCLLLSQLEAINSESSIACC